MPLLTTRRGKYSTTTAAKTSPLPLAVSTPPPGTAQPLRIICHRDTDRKWRTTTATRGTCFAEFYQMWCLVPFTGVVHVARTSRDELSRVTCARLSRRVRFRCYFTQLFSFPNRQLWFSCGSMVLRILKTLDRKKIVRSFRIIRKSAKKIIHLHGCCPWYYRYFSYII